MSNTWEEALDHAVEEYLRELNETQDSDLYCGFIDGAWWAKKATVVQLMHLIRSGKVTTDMTNHSIIELL